jgi:hypothetical protein
MRLTLTRIAQHIHDALLHVGSQLYIPAQLVYSHLPLIAPVEYRQARLVQTAADDAHRGFRFSMAINYRMLSLDGCP